MLSDHVSAFAETPRLQHSRPNQREHIVEPLTHTLPPCGVFSLRRGGCAVPPFCGGPHSYYHLFDKEINFFAKKKQKP